MTRAATIAIALVCLLSTTAAQDNYWQHIKRNGWSYAAFGLAGVFDGAADTMRDKYSVSVFPQEQPGRQFWDPQISWENKYRNWPTDTRPAYPGAKTWLVWTTDGWHMAKAGSLASAKVAILTYHRPPRKIVVVPALYPDEGTREEKRTRWLWFIGDFAIDSLAFSAGWAISSELLTKN